jgi:hypothetical protein
MTIFSQHWFPSAPRGEGGRTLIAHAENERAHTADKSIASCAENGMALAIHPPYSPDRAPSDRFLFGHVKCCLQGIAFASYEELLVVIGEIVTDIPKETLHLLFGHWMQRLDWTFQHNRDYYR